MAMAKVLNGILLADVADGRHYFRPMVSWIET